MTLLWPLFLLVALVSAAAVHGWMSGRAKLISSDRQKLEKEIEARLRSCNQQISDMKWAAKTSVSDQRHSIEQLKQELAADTLRQQRQIKSAENELKARLELVNELREQFSIGFLNGRKWLAAYIADADRVLDDKIAADLRQKKRPARSASEEVAAARAERRAFKERATFLEYQLKSYEEYFPLLAEYRELILDEAVSLDGVEDKSAALQEADPVLHFVSKVEYDQLSTLERNQRALDSYRLRNHSDLHIGRFYERYIGYLWERDGWEVEYFGIMKGLEDLGRDLVCKKGHEVKIIQTKCWSKHKLIHEKHIFQLFGTMQHFLMNASDRLFPPEVTGWFYTTTELSPIARQAAKFLKINIKENFALDKSYPMIKCNINQTTKEKIYHLPFDQQYDTTRIIPNLGECYLESTAEAEALGFRRAWRHQYRASNT